MGAGLIDKILATKFRVAGYLVLFADAWGEESIQAIAQAAGVTLQRRGYCERNVKETHSRTI